MGSAGADVHAHEFGDGALADVEHGGAVFGERVDGVGGFGGGGWGFGIDAEDDVAFAEPGVGGWGVGLDIVDEEPGDFGGEIEGRSGGFVDGEDLHAGDVVGVVFGWGGWGGG